QGSLERLQNEHRHRPPERVECGGNDIRVPPHDAHHNVENESRNTNHRGEREAATHLPNPSSERPALAWNQSDRFKPGLGGSPDEPENERDRRKPEYEA